jgi:hypothetical protein
MEDDRDPRRGKKQDPRHQARPGLEKAGAELAHCLLPGRRGRLGFDHGHEPIMSSPPCGEVAAQPPEGLEYRSSRRLCI